jgi:hypothetical protein
LQEPSSSLQFAGFVTTGSPLSTRREAPHDQLHSASNQKEYAATIAQYKLELNELAS